MRTWAHEAEVHKTAMNNFATLITCTVEVLTPFLERHLANILSLRDIWRKFLSSACKVRIFHLNQSYVPLLKFTGPL
jgi:hypothetical protein